MPVRSFDADAQVAIGASLPVPRGIAFRYRPNPAAAAKLADLQALLDDELPAWEIRAVAGLPDWFEAIPPGLPVAPGQSQPIPLSQFWLRLRQLSAMPGVERAEPLFLIANPELPTDATATTFALGTRRGKLGLWGWPYGADLAEQIKTNSAESNWHLIRLKVREAWAIWEAKHPGKEPGAGIVVGHPDTGYTDHPEVAGRFLLPGHSFLRDDQGEEEPDAKDDLLGVGGVHIENPGHGTATASVIVSGASDLVGLNGAEAYGVAPGARILPLRVSRSVIHFDFGNLARAILYAVDQDVDVISMSLGGPLSSDFLRECIRQALDQGIIVVSAAGNMLPATAFPAAYPEVVAVAATHAVDEPWRFSGIGRLVDIAAPGEDVWRARAGGSDAARFDVATGTGTSFATACVAGIAALWLSYHGGRAKVADFYGGERALVPFAFQLLLARTANTGLEFVEAGKHGAGLADAERLLLEPLPAKAEVERFAAVVKSQPVGKLTFLAGLFSGGRALAERPGVELAAAAVGTAEGVEQTEAVVQAGLERDTEVNRLREFAEELPAHLVAELVSRLAADRYLLVGFQEWQPDQSRLPLLNRLLGIRVDHDGGEPAPTPTLSEDLQDALAKIKTEEEETIRALHKGKLVPGVRPAGADGAVPASLDAALSPRPITRGLRAYSFDPSLETSLETTRIHEVTIPVRWENLEPGPIGEYLEVIDIDPASECAYSPVDLNHPYLLAQDGLAPSERSPQFHQQMVYAFAMTTIERFEQALGRPIFWSNLRAWSQDHPEEWNLFTPESLQDEEFAAPAANGRSAPSRARRVRRLRVYPHALREANAYYDPAKRALLFGYFPGGEEVTGRYHPGGLVFTCLSHDIIVHETTHALVDGMHPYFNEPSNEDVWAFHEAFADIMALFQHFTYPEVLHHQIATARGDLESNNLLGRLAQQFGQATGRPDSLRNYLGKEDEHGVWQRTKPNPRALESTVESHERGSILVAAVFDAFLALYNDRVADLLRISTGGTGVLPAGRIHPDLANRLAEAAAAAAAEVQRACIRAMDYVPPVDITFGDFLRALVTADYELSSVPKSRTRVAFINAFQSWGIYPLDVSTLSENSLLWRGPDPDAPFQHQLDEDRTSHPDADRLISPLVAAIDGWQPGRQRAEVFDSITHAQGLIHILLGILQAHAGDQPLIPGLDLRRGASYSVGNLRPARRVGPQGEFRTELVVEIVQTYRTPAAPGPAPLPFRGGATVIIDLQSWQIRYVIYKRLYLKLPDEAGGDGGTPVNRYNRQRRMVRPAVWEGEASASLARHLAATYTSPARRLQLERTGPFALLHRNY